MPARCCGHHLWTWRWEIWRTFDMTANGELGEYVHAYSIFSSSHAQKPRCSDGVAQDENSTPQAKRGKVGCNNVRPEETGEEQGAHICPFSSFYQKVAHHVRAHRHSIRRYKVACETYSAHRPSDDDNLPSSWRRILPPERPFFLPTFYIYHRRFLSSNKNKPLTHASRIIVITAIATH